MLHSPLPPTRMMSSMKLSMMSTPTDAASASTTTIRFWNLHVGAQMEQGLTDWNWN